MQERERVIVTGLVVFLLLLWLGFLIHVDPRFAGGLPGFIVGFIAFLLLLVPAAYSLVKRVPRLKQAITKRVPMRTLLAWHIYASILGGILAIIHSGHRFASRVGILLISLTLLVILSGFVGRYLMTQISKEIKEKYALLDRAKAQYDRTAQELRGRPDLAASVAGYAGFFSRLFAPLKLRRQATNDGVAAIEWRAVQLGESVADLEYAVKTHELFKLWFARWLRFHIAISVTLACAAKLGVYRQAYISESPPTALVSPILRIHDRLVSYETDRYLHCGCVQPWSDALVPQRALSQSLSAIAAHLARVRSAARVLRNSLQ